MKEDYSYSSLMKDKKERAMENMKFLIAKVPQMLADIFYAADADDFKIAYSILIQGQILVDMLLEYEEKLMGDDEE